MNIAFPVFIRAKDSGEVSMFNSIGEMQAELESIDIENGEYDAWDVNAVPLNLAARTRVWIELCPQSPDPKPEELKGAILDFASKIGIETVEIDRSERDFKALLKRITSARRKISAHNLLTRWRKKQ